MIAFVTPPILLLSCFKRFMVFIVSAVLMLASIANTAWAEYKPLDISDIKGEQRSQLSELVRMIRRMSPQSRDAFLCEQLGLCFAADGSQVMQRGPSANRSKALFVGRSGLPLPFDQAVSESSDWDKCYRITFQINQIKEGAVLGFFTKDIDCIACNTAKYLLEEMPDEERWLLLATLDSKLYHKDGSSAYNVSCLPTMDCGIECQWRGDWGDSSFYVGPDGKERTALKNCSTMRERWRNVLIIFRCENLVGWRDIVALFPGEVKAMRKQYKQRLAQMKEQTDATAKEDKDSRASHRNVMGGTSSDGAASPRDAQYAEGIAALRRMSAALRRAWLAEGMGFCYTQSDAPAYVALHIANDNALFVDKQGKERSLSRVATDKMAPDWVAATKAALAVGYEQIAAPFKEEVKKLAVQTATYILNKMPKEVRFSWLSETNKLLFQADGKPIYPSSRQSSTFGYVTSQRFKISYAGRLYYSPQGRIEQAQWPEWSIWGTRWCTLFRCENLVGIEAINNSFKEDVKAMRAAYEKSPFYKK